MEFLILEGDQLREMTRKTREQTNRAGFQIFLAK